MPQGYRSRCARGQGCWFVGDGWWSAGGVGELVRRDGARARRERPGLATLVRRHGWLRLNRIRRRRARARRLAPRAAAAPGAKEGAVLEHVTRELTIEALRTDIRDSIQHDASEMQIGDRVLLEAVRAPANVQLLDEPETVAAPLPPPRLQIEEEEEIE